MARMAVASLPRGWSAIPSSASRSCSSLLGQAPLHSELSLVRGSKSNKDKPKGTITHICTSHGLESVQSLPVQKTVTGVVTHAVAEISTEIPAVNTDEEMPVVDDMSRLKLESDLLKKKAKRAELRRKRLVRKRRMRKKGRWPPSKMAKLKNV